LQFFSQICLAADVKMADVGGVNGPDSGVQMFESHVSLLHDLDFEV